MNKLGKIFVIIGISLIIISTSILINNIYIEKVASKKSTEVLKLLKDNINTQQLTINNEQIITREMKTTNINGYEYIGIINIPNINLELPVISEYDYDKLNIAPCRYYGSIHTNDLIICGHSYKTHFQSLTNVKQGDTVIITDPTNESYIYEVLEIEILEPNNVDKMINNEFDLTLYTCTNDGLNRITIRCNRVTGKF